MKKTHPIMLVRHAEKPLPQVAEGVDGPGTRGKRGLSPRGQWRARLLVDYFVPIDGKFRDPEIGLPVAVFAANTSGEHRSTRPADTVRPVAESIGLSVHEDFGSDPPFDKVAAVIEKAAARGPVLVAWRFDTLPDLARAFGVKNAPPWPADRFDMTWVLRKEGKDCTMTQVPQLLMQGDSVEPIAAPHVGKHAAKKGAKHAAKKAAKKAAKHAAKKAAKHAAKKAAGKSATPPASPR
jgi:hypothetical protein